MEKSLQFFFFTSLIVVSMYGSNLLSDAFLIVLFLVSFGFSGVPSYCLLPYLPLFIIGIGVAFAECLVEII